MKTSELTYSGYYPGVIGELTRLHAVYYHQHWGFDLSFETQVGGDLAEFFGRFEDRTDHFQAAREQKKLAGAIAIDGALRQTEGARLRWFIVDEPWRGRGLGRRLIRDAVEFCRRAGHDRVFLWTFAGLDPARRLYEAHGFQLTEKHRVSQWGSTVDEQRFDLTLV
ncbi:MAG: GNAT family N-acetyltransferase [Proteobacteria bacterium]|nr:GNAT family N-acetyltransferase [Pseudomonadota bacterium]